MKYWSMDSLTEEDLNHLAFLDESCARTNFTPLYGWSFRGVRLPGYSPDFNPIENMWSQIKGKLRKSEPGDFIELWREANYAHLEFTAENAADRFKGCGYFR